MTPALFHPFTPPGVVMSFAPPLATPADALRLGVGTVSTESLARASSRARAFLGQSVTRGTSTVTVSRGRVHLPQRPLKAVLTATDQHGRPVYWESIPGGLHTHGTGKLTVTYLHGVENIPDSFRELICTIARRLDSLSGSAVEAGVTSEGAGGETVSFGGDAWGGVSTLVRAEKEALAKFFPPRPRLIVVGA